MILKSGDKFITGDYIVEILSFNNRILKLRDHLGEFTIDFTSFKNDLEKGLVTRLENTND